LRILDSIHNRTSLGKFDKKSHILGKKIPVISKTGNISNWEHLAKNANIDE